MKPLILLVLALALMFAAGAAAAATPGKTTAGNALRSYMASSLHDRNWSAVITCRGYATPRRYTCTWRNAVGHGAALIVFAPGTGGKVTVTPK